LIDWCVIPTLTVFQLYCGVPITNSSNWQSLCKQDELMQSKNFCYYQTRRETSNNVTYQQKDEHVLQQICISNKVGQKLIEI